jgi:hypothetical protein
MMQKVEVISNALALLGQKPINTLENQNSITSAAEQAYDFLLPYILSTGFWRFATRQVQLSQLNLTPPTTIWNYVYQLPGDYLKMVRQIPHNWAYEIFTDNQMYSNIQGPLFIEYIFKPLAGQIPYYFNGYLIYRIAEYLALSSANNVQFDANLEQRMGVAMGVALAADCQNRPTTPMISQPIIADRAVSFFVYG